MTRARKAQKSIFELPVKVCLILGDNHQRNGV